MGSEDLEQLYNRVWRTAGARFNAARRLRRRARLSQVTMGVISTYVVIAALTPRFVDISATASAAIVELVLVAASLMVLCLTLLEAGRTNIIEAERLFRSANLLSGLRNRIEADRGSSSLDPDKSGDYRREYSGLVAQWEENHEPIDDLLFQAEHRHVFWKRNKSRTASRLEFLDPLCSFTWAMGIQLRARGGRAFVYGILAIIPGLALAWAIYSLLQA